MPPASPYPLPFYWRYDLDCEGEIIVHPDDPQRYQVALVYDRGLAGERRQVIGGPFQFYEAVAAAREQFAINVGWL